MMGITQASDGQPITRPLWCDTTFHPLFWIGARPSFGAYGVAVSRCHGAQRRLRCHSVQNQCDVRTAKGRTVVGSHRSIEMGVLVWPAWRIFSFLEPELFFWDADQYSGKDTLVMSDQEEPKSAHSDVIKGSRTHAHSLPSMHATATTLIDANVRSNEVEWLSTDHFES
jgi:hypothetical protein